MRHNPATVVVLAGHASPGLLNAVSRSMNVSLVTPETGADGEPGGPGGPSDVIEAAAGALRRAAGISSPYVLVTADPLAQVAAQWQAMWEIAAEPRGSEAFELAAAQALAAWRAKRFELPDYYLVLAADGEAQENFYLGPLRAVRPHRVSVVAAAESAPAEQAAGLLSALGSLRQGRWWPPLADVLDTARRFYPGALARAVPGNGLPAAVATNRPG